MRVLKHSGNNPYSRPPPESGLYDGLQSGIGTGGVLRVVGWIQSCFEEAVPQNEISTFVPLVFFFFFIGPSYHFHMGTNQYYVRTGR